MVNFSLFLHKTYQKARDVQINEHCLDHVMVLSTKTVSLLHVDFAGMA